VVSVITAAADITFKAASGACLKALVPPEDLLVASGRFESTAWTATALGPPLGGAAFGLFGPVTTVLADAVSYLISAMGIRAIGGSEPRTTRTGTQYFPDQPVPTDRRGIRVRDLPDGWRYILTHPALRPLFFNTIGVNALILATAPLLAVLMLGRLHFAPWQYGRAFVVPCVGGLIGSRLARRLAARFGRYKVMLTAGTLRACWPVGLAFIGSGAAGLALVMAIELGLIRVSRSGFFPANGNLTAWPNTRHDRIKVPTSGSWSPSGHCCPTSRRWSAAWPRWSWTIRPGWPGGASPSWPDPAAPRPPAWCVSAGPSVCAAIPSCGWRWPAR
jgi:hypothetical protein